MFKMNFGYTLNFNYNKNYSRTINNNNSIDPAIKSQIQITHPADQLCDSPYYFGTQKPIKVRGDGPHKDLSIFRPPWQTSMSQGAYNTKLLCPPYKQTWMPPRRILQRLTVPKTIEKVHESLYDKMMLSSSLFCICTSIKNPQCQDTSGKVGTFISLLSTPGANDKLSQPRT